MEIEGRLAQLIEQGAAIQVTLQEPRVDMELLLAAAVMLEDPKRLRWCAIFPEHQSHVHEVPYDAAVFEAGGRDIAFMRDGKIVMYVCPYEESTLDLDSARNGLAEWRGMLARYTNVAKFKEFFETV